MKNLSAKLLSLFHKKNLLLGLSVIIKFLAIGVAILITRWQNIHLDPETLKNFNLTLAYLAIILGIVGFGIPQILYKIYTNETDQTKLNEVWSTFLVLRVISYFVGVTIILATFKLSRVDDLMMILGVFSAQFVLLSDQSFRSVVDSRDLSQRFSFTDLFGKLLLTSTLYLGVWLNFLGNSGISFFVFASIGVYLLVYVLDQAINLKLTGFVGFKTRVFRENLRPLIYLALPGFIFVNSLDRIFLEYVGVDKYELNGYSNAVKIFEVAGIFSSLIVPVIASRLKTRLKSYTTQEARLNFRRYIGYLAIIGVIYSLSIYLLSPVIFKILDPKALYSSYSLAVMPFFCLALLTGFVNFFYYNLNIFNHLEKRESIYYYSYSVIFALILFIFTKNWGYVGSGLAFVCLTWGDLIFRTFVFKTKITARID